MYQRWPRSKNWSLKTNRQCLAHQDCLPGQGISVASLLRDGPPRCGVYGLHLKCVQLSLAASQEV